MDVAALSPKGAILEAWPFVEEAATKLVQANSSTTGNWDIDRPHLGLQQLLSKNGLLAEDELKLYADLRRLRNKVAHTTGEAVNVEEAREFVRLAFQLVDAIEPKAPPT